MPADRGKKNGNQKPPKGGSTRTHEENQERAYVAASRRSDRSLEARVESARRASEIHRQRTGRGLKVTEQDVMNEEMYEEEDVPQTPGQYINASRHMLTGDPEFDRRFQNYITTQLALRTAQIHSQYRNNPQLAYQMQMQFPNPMLAPQAQNQNQMQQIQEPQELQQSLMQQRLMQQRLMQQQQMNTARQAPYPQPRQSSISSQQQQLDATNVESLDQTDIAMRSPYIQRHPSVTETVYRGSSTSSTSPSVRPSIENQRRPSFPEGTFAQLKQPTQFSNNSYEQFATNGLGNSGGNSNAGALPRNIQMFLQGTMDPNSPMASHLMAGSESNPSYDWSTNTMQGITPTGKVQSYPTTLGLNSTLSAAADQVIRDDEPPTSSQEFIVQTQTLNRGYTEQEQVSSNTPDLVFSGANMDEFFHFDTFAQ